MHSNNVSFTALIQSCTLDKRRLISNCRAIDCELLDNGFCCALPAHRCVEVVGAPGSGKTQFCMQLAVDVSIPRALDGYAGRCVYIDTESALCAERLAQMADALVDKMREISECGDEIDGLTRETILRNIEVVRVHQYQSLLGVLDALPGHLTRAADVRLVVIDSVAAVFRGALDDRPMQRIRLLTRVAQQLNRVAREHNVLVVCSNHQSVARANDSLPFQVVPALGERWRHWCGTRLWLKHDGVQRTARLCKGEKSARAAVRFRITKKGIRDVAQEDDND